MGTDKIVAPIWKMFDDEGNYVGAVQTYCVFTIRRWLREIGISGWHAEGILYKFDDKGGSYREVSVW